MSLGGSQLYATYRSFGGRFTCGALLETGHGQLRALRTAFGFRMFAPGHRRDMLAWLLAPYQARKAWDFARHSMPRPGCGGDHATASGIGEGAHAASPGTCRCRRGGARADLGQWAASLTARDQGRQEPCTAALPHYARVCRIWSGFDPAAYA